MQKIQNICNPHTDNNSSWMSNCWTNSYSHTYSLWVDTSSCYIHVKFSNWYTYPLNSKIAKAKNTTSICQDNHVYLQTKEENALDDSISTKLWVFVQKRESISKRLKSGRFSQLHYALSFALFRNINYLTFCTQVFHRNFWKENWKE